MKTTQSIEIIETMFKENKKSLHRNSFYFIMWGILLIPSGIAEYLLYGHPSFWMIWPAMGIMGGIISFAYGMKESKRSGVKTSGDRITSFTWGAFGFTMIFSIAYTMHHQLPPHALILMLAGSATFISGGISKFNPFILGGLVMELGAIICAFVVDQPYQGLVFAGSFLFGYVIPGIILRKSEHDKA